MELSIIIPCFNRIALLKETLSSVASAINGIQTEIILVDDGSDQPVITQLSAFADLPIKPIRQANSGLTTARFNGLQAASGTYVHFLDSDDLVAVDKFTLQMAAMRAANADVSYTDVLEHVYGADPASGFITRNLKSATVTTPSEFYLQVQPPPHSPVFRREYLMHTLKQAFIPLTRTYDSIGEVWFYYNLAPFPARIIKVSEPLTIIVHHQLERLTDHWELQGLCALALQKEFARRLPPNLPYSQQSRKLVSRSAFETFRRLPANISPLFLSAFLDNWRALGATRELNAGKGFRLVSTLFGPVAAARLIKRLTSKKDYLKMKSIEPGELELRLKSLLHSFDNTYPL